MLRKISLWGILLGLVIGTSLAPVIASPPRQANSYPVITAENVANLAEIDVIGEGIYASVAWSPDDSNLYVGNPLGLYRLPADDLNATPEAILNLGYAPFWGFQYHGGEIALTEDEDAYIVWSLAEGSELFQIEDVYQAYLNPYSAQVVTKDTSDTIKVFDGLTGEITSEFLMPGEFSWPSVEFVFSHNPARLYITEDDLLNVIDSATGEIQMTYTLPNDDMGVFETPDGSLLILNGGRGDDGNVHFLDAETLEEIVVWETGLDKPPLTSFHSFSPDGKYLVVNAGIWDMENQAEAYASRPTFGSTWFSADGTVLYTTQDVYHFADFLSAGQEVPDSIADINGYIRSFAVNSAGTQVAITTSSSIFGGQWRLYILDVTTGEVLQERTALSGSYDVAYFMPDSTQIVAVSSVANSVRVIDIATHEVVHEVSGMRISAGVARGNGQFAITSSKQVHIFDGATGELSLLTELETNVKAITFSPDGMLLAIGDSDNNIVIWDMTTLEPQQEFPMEANIQRIRLFHEQNLMIVQLAGGIRTAYDLTTGDASELPDFGVGNGLLGFAFNREGTQLAVSGDGIMLWEWPNMANEPTSYDSLFLPNIFYNHDETLLIGHNENGFAIWDIASQERVFSINLALGPLNTIKLSPDGTLLISASRDGSVRLYAVVE